MSPVKRRIQQRKAWMMAVLMAAFLILSAIMPVKAQAAAKALDPSVDTVIANVKNYMLSVDKTPDYSSIWNVLAMSRSSLDAPADYKKRFYDNTVNYMIDNNWDLDTSRSSDYAKLILAMTAIGKDARQINGHNLFDYLDDFDYVKRQGFNGPVWALTAVNSHPDYTLDNRTGADNPTTVEGILQYILSRETTSGGWTLYGNVPDTDITAMTLQALAPFYGAEGRENITAAMDRALSWLSASQMASGGYGTLSGSGVLETSESVSQAVVALSALGIDPAEDPRFIKNGAWPMSRLFEYYLSQGGFMHVEAGGANNGGGAAGTLDGMATEQGMYATVAYQRMLSGKTALYDMSDITLAPGGAPDAPSTTATKPATKPATETTRADTAPDTTGKGSATTSQKKVKVTKLTLNYKQITLNRGKTRTLKLKVTPSNATNKKVKWKSSNKKVATVTQKGKVKAVRAGKANITVTAQDGSGKKAVCKVIVKNPSSKSSSSGSGSGSSGKVKVTDVSLSFKQISVAVGASRTLTAVVTPTNASNRKLTWSSSSKSIATVSQSGTVTGKRSGTATITAKAKDGSGKSSSCTVIVYGAGSVTSNSGQTGNASTSNGSGGSGQIPQGVQQRISTASGQQGGGTATSQGTGSQTSGSGTGGQTSGESGNSKTPDGTGTNASTEAGAWSFDGEAYVPESSGSSNGEADVWLADGAPFPEYDAGQESAEGDIEGEYTGYTEELSGPEETEGSDLPPWLAVLLGLVVPGGLAGSFKVPWQKVGDKMLLLAAMRKKE